MYICNMGAEAIIKIVRSDIAKMAEMASKGVVDKAIARGINYALKRSRTQMKRAVLEEYNLPASAVVANNNGGSITISPARQGKLFGMVNADKAAESLAHFRPVWYKDVSGGWGHNKGGGGGGFIKHQRRGKEYKATTYANRNTTKSGVYVNIVKSKGQMCIPGAFMIFKGTSPVVMARGKYQNTGQTHDFKFTKPRTPINRLNTKSVYWGVLHPASMVKWEPDTYKDFIDETERQIALLCK